LLAPSRYSEPELDTHFGSPAILGLESLRSVVLRPRLSAGMPLSDGQYAKFSFLLQDQRVRILRSVTSYCENRQLRHISMTIIRLENLLKAGASGTLSKIIQRAQNMDELTTALRAALPTDAGQSLLAANLRENGELVLICTSSAWAARLRFESDKLMEVARRAGLMVNSCRVSVSQKS